MLSGIKNDLPTTFEHEGQKEGVIESLPSRFKGSLRTLLKCY